VTTTMAFLGLIGLLLLGSWGWGRTAVRWAMRLGWPTAQSDVPPALQLVVGVALFLAAGGVLVALGLADVGVLVAWHAVGVVLLVAATRRSPGRDAAPVGGWRTLALAVVGAGLAVLVVGVAIGDRAVNVNDDDPGYIYLAQRLARTGGLVDPFNFRRITSYGGSTLYQSLFLRLCGDASLRGFEYGFGVALVLILTVGTLRRRGLVLGVAVIGVGLLLGHGVGPVANLSATFSATALTLGAYQLLTRLPAGREPVPPGLCAVIGVVLAGIVALRFYFVIPVALSLVAVAWVGRGRHGVTPVLVTAGSGLVGTLGWAVASWRSSGTPFFALFPGNYDAAVPGGAQPGIGVGVFLRFVGRAGLADGAGLVAVASVVAGTVILARRPDSRTAPVVLASGLATVLQLVLLSYEFSGGEATDPARFVGPSSLACGLFLLGVAWPLRRPRAAPGAGAAASGVPGTIPGPVVPWWGRLPPRPRAALGAALLVAFGGLVFYVLPADYVHTGTGTVRAALRVAGRSSAYTEPYRRLETDYERVNALIPSGARVLSAVDQPAFLAVGRYQVATLDIPGFASPPPHFPVFGDTADQIGYLRRLGYHYVVASSPDAVGLYDIDQWLTSERDRAYFYRTFAGYMVRWDSTVVALERDPGHRVHVEGPLALIDLG